jgi:hypothetical protein
MESELGETTPIVFLLSILISACLLILPILVVML